MGCGCKGNRQQFEVVTTTDGKEKVVYTSTSENTAKSVARRYEGSIVRPKGQAAAPANQAAAGGAG